MSMIENQISRLNEIRKELDCDIINWRQDWAKEIKDAISTIQELSAKLAAANMERSTAHYNGGWIPVEERLPEMEAYVLLSLRRLDIYTGFRASTDGYFYADGEGYVEYENVIAWMPLPEPYKEKH